MACTRASPTAWRYARLGLLELLDAAARQAHHGAPLHLERE